MMRKMENQSKISDELRTDARRHDPTNGGRNTCTWAGSRLAYRPSMPYGYATGVPGSVYPSRNQRKI